MRLLVISLLLLLASTALAEDARIPDLDPSWVEVDPGRFTIVPGGTGPSLSAQGVVIHLWLVDGFGGPVNGYPAQDIWLDDIGNADIAICPGGSIADADTDTEGHTTISHAIAGGGWTQSGMSVYVAGIAIAQTPRGDDYVLPLEVVSPDFNADLNINIQDVALFADDLVAENLRSDFNHDGVVDLSDIALFGNWLVNGGYCP